MAITFHDKFKKKKSVSMDTFGEECIKEVYKNIHTQYSSL